MQEITEIRLRDTPHCPDKNNSTELWSSFVMRAKPKNIQIAEYGNNTTILQKVIKIVN